MILEPIISPLFVGEFDPEDFSPVKIRELPVALNELSVPQLRSLLVQLRMSVRHEMRWQHDIGFKDESRLITIADLYVEAQEYYAQFDEKLKERISSDKYVPVLRLGDRIW